MLLAQLAQRARVPGWSQAKTLLDPCVATERGSSQQLSSPVRGASCRLCLDAR